MVLWNRVTWEILQSGWMFVSALGDQCEGQTNGRVKQGHKSNQMIVNPSCTVTNVYETC